MPHREILPIFHHTAKEASEIGEMEQWQSSHRENVACKEYIEMTIRENFDGMYLSSNCAKQVIDEFGHSRTAFVLANSLQHSNHDGRFSNQNKQWANGFSIPEEEYHQNVDYAVTSHPAILDGFVNQYKTLYQTMIEQELLETLTESLSAEQRCDLDEITEDHAPSLEAKAEINIIYALKNGQYEIYRDVDDTHDAAVEYINREYPGLDEIVFSNLDFDGVEIDIGGKLCSVGYILPLKNDIEPVYDGTNAEELLAQLEHEPQQSQGMEMSL